MDGYKKGPPTDFRSELRMPDQIRRRKGWLFYGGRPSGFWNRKNRNDHSPESQGGENGLLAQLARAPALHAGGREFESLTVHKKIIFGM